MEKDVVTWSNKSQQAPSKENIDKLFINMIKHAVTGNNPVEVAEVTQRGEQAYAQLRGREQIVLTLVMYGESFTEIAKLYNRSARRVAEVYKMAQLRFIKFYR